MDSAVMVGVALVALVLGVAVGWLVGRRGADAQVAQARTEVATLTATLQAKDEAFGDRLAAVVLEASQQVGANLADRTAEDANARLDAQKTTLEGVVGNVTTKLADLEAKVANAEKAQIESSSQLAERLESVSSATGELTDRTGRLTSVLEGGSTRGRWGEFQLQRIIEVAGLTPHITWQTQAQDGGGKGAQRPDLLVHIPEKRVLVVDAKAPTLNLDGDGPTGEADGNYAKRLRAHIKALGRKEYVDGIPNAVGHVFLFLPSEAAYAGALRADPEVLVFAADNRVAVVAPSTLLSALTVVATVWTEFEANNHLEAAVAEARELHKRLGVFAGHLNKVGLHLGRMVTDFNKAVGSLERQVYPAARRMEQANMAQGNLVLTVDALDVDGVRSVAIDDAEQPAGELPAPEAVRAADDMPAVDTGEATDANV